MKIVIQLFCITFTFVCCKTIKTDNTLFGEYYSKGKDYEYKLRLRDNNVFDLHIKYQDANPQCEGVWKLMGNRVINLQCGEVSDITETLSNGYMNEREHNLEIMSNRKLKFKGVTLIKRK